MKFQPYPNLVADVAVYDKSHGTCLTTWNVISALAHSSGVGMGLKYWVAGIKFRVSWPERRPNGCIHGYPLNKLDTFEISKGERRSLSNVELDTVFDSREGRYH